MHSLRKIALAGTVFLSSLAYRVDAQEIFSNHLYNFNHEISEEMNDPSSLENSNLIIKVQEGYELDEDEQEKVRDFFQNKAGNYLADRLIDRLKEFGLRKYVEPIEKVAKGVEIKIPKTNERVKIKPDVDLDSENNLQGGLDFSYRNVGVSIRSDIELKARAGFFEEGNKRLSIEAGYNKGLFLGLRFGIIY